jgi:uncharacterized protein YkwD
VDPPPIPVTPSPDVQIFALINQARQAIGIPALSLDDQLIEAAQIQASAMAMLRVMQHDLPGMPQPDFPSRLHYVGYSYQWAGENLGVGPADVPTIVSLWLDSPPHRDNILSPYPTSTGVAVAYDTQGRPYFCQVYGLSR